MGVTAPVSRQVTGPATVSAMARTSAAQRRHSVALGNRGCFKQVERQAELFVGREPTRRLREDGSAVENVADCRQQRRARAARHTGWRCAGRITIEQVLGEPALDGLGDWVVHGEWSSCERRTDHSHAW